MRKSCFCYLFRLRKIKKCHQYYSLPNSRECPKQIFNLIEFPSRSLRLTAPRIQDKHKTKKRKRTMIYESVRVYANLPRLVRDLPERLFINHIKMWPIDLSQNPV